MKLGCPKRIKKLVPGLLLAISRKAEVLSVVMLGMSALFGVLILARVGGLFVDSARAERLVKRAFEQSKPDPNDLKKYFAQSKSVAEELKKKNLFVPPEPKQHPVKQVSGILGDETLINGKWYKVGDKVADAKITAIEPARVKIEWEGKEKTFAPIDAASAPEPNEKGEKPVTGKREGRRAIAERPRKEKVAAPAEEDPLAWMGVKLSDALRAKLLEKWNSMSDEEKQQWKDQWNKIPDEQKQKMVDSMEENIDKM